MKKGFTMIELIFVIVILGILAAVAVPKLNATRDDAEVAKAASNFATVINDLTSYYTAQGQFDTANWRNMTNVQGDGNFQVKGKTCATITLDSAAGTIVVAADASNTDNVCTSFKDLDSVKNIIGGDFSASRTITVGASGVNFNATTN
ncbi:type II secretion system protein [Campylobacter sp. MG1]|uniref:type II secretion system protein n=1 Tax=Campylobacter sp. MG1 TaxID=2976332 RepID=UPI00226D2EC2|nr:type II secretion system protein [Campylobacter sp. MG1]